MRSPGNLYSVPKHIALDPLRKQTVKLVGDQVIPPFLVPPNSGYVERFRFQSTAFTKFRGRPRDGVGDER